MCFRVEAKLESSAAATLLLSPPHLLLDAPARLGCFLLSNSSLLQPAGPANSAAACVLLCRDTPGLLAGLSAAGECGCLSAAEARAELVQAGPGQCDSGQPGMWLKNMSEPMKTKSITQLSS